MMKKVCFIRKNGHFVARGTVADIPFDADIRDVRKFIVVQVDSSSIPEGVEVNPTVRLKLDELMVRYPTTEDAYVDEEGAEQTRTIHGYFSELGNSSKPYPIITMNEVTYE